MSTSILILNVCFLILMAETNPTPQKIQTCSGTYCEQTGYRNSLKDSVKGAEKSENTMSFVLAPNQIASTCQRNEVNYLAIDVLKLLYDRILSHPVTLYTIKTVGKPSTDVDISHLSRVPSNVQNIANNYIILLADALDNDIKALKEYNYPECIFVNPNTCRRVKKEARKLIGTLESHNLTNFTTGMKQTDEKYLNNIHEHQDDLNTQNFYKLVLSDVNDSQKEYSKKSFKRNSQKKNNTIQFNKILNKNANFNEFSMNENKIYELYKNDNEKLKINNSYKQGKKEKPGKKKQVKANSSSSDINQYKTNSKTSITSNKTNQISKIYDNKLNKQPKTIRPIEKNRKNQLKGSDINNYKEKQTYIENNSRSRDKKDYDHKKKTTGSSYQFPNMPYSSHDMYKYLNAILPNYQLLNTELSKDFPFNFNNIYQFSQQPFAWNNKYTSKNKSKLYRRRKLRNDNKNRFKKKKFNPRKKQTEKKPFAEVIKEISTENNILESTSPNSLRTLIYPRFDTVDKIKVNLSENPTIQKSMTSLEELDFRITLDNLLVHNNTLIESLNYNSYPSFILGTEETIPILFENGLIDDYYPNFTADNEVNKEIKLSKYYGDKYHVSNQYNDFEDNVKARKRLAMKNMNKSSNLFFSESDMNKNVEPVRSIGSKQDKETKSMVQFQSPPLLDNPDFRTRKIDSNEVYEPYYYHNTFQDPDEDFNKYYVDDKSIVYSTSTSSKHNLKSKICNDIEEDSKSKWKKIKNSNVETIHARSKLAKYGLNF